MCGVEALSALQVAFATAGQAQAARRNAVAAGDAYVANAFGIAEQTRQYDQQQTDAMTARSRQAMNDLGTINAIFADSGLDGASQERIKNVTEGQAAADLTTLDRNQATRASQATAEQAAARARMQSQVNAVRGPSLLGAGLQIAGYGAAAYDKEHPRATK